MDFHSSIQIIPVDIKMKSNYKSTRLDVSNNIERFKVKNNIFYSESSKVTLLKCFMYPSRKVFYSYTSTSCNWLQYWYWGYWCLYSDSFYFSSLALSLKKKSYQLHRVNKDEESRHSHILLKLLEGNLFLPTKTKKKSS